MITFPSYTWLGIGAEDFERTVQFFRETVALSLIVCKERSQYALFHLPSGQDFEIFGPHSRWYNLQRYPVLGFEVTNIQSAYEYLQNQGVKFASEIVSAPGWGSFSYFYGPDNYLYEIVQRCPIQPPDVKVIVGYDLIKVITTTYLQTTHFFANIMQFPLALRNDRRKVAVFQLTSGQTLEINGPSQNSLSFNAGSEKLRVGFRVGDVYIAHKYLKSRGVHFVSSMELSDNGTRSACFCDQDNHLFFDLR
jgi:catechol 2,3-dioxygenase-like lactoylglutathione lyase family enzyme